jgi:hypothetical protein
MISIEGDSGGQYGDSKGTLFQTKFEQGDRQGHNPLGVSPVPRMSRTLF